MWPLPAFLPALYTATLLGDFFGNFMCAAKATFSIKFILFLLKILKSAKHLGANSSLFRIPRWPLYLSEFSRDIWGGYDEKAP